MRTVSQESRRRTGGRAAAIFGPALAVLTGTISTRPAQALPLVLPKQSLPYLCQLNGKTGFTLICVSQAPNPNTGTLVQTAVVDLSPPGGGVIPGGTFPLFVFPQDVPMIEQLNNGVPINPGSLFQLPTSSSGTSTQVAQVIITEPGQLQGGPGAMSDLLVCPAASLPVLGQLNPGLTFSVLCISQVGTDKSSADAQTALLEVQSPSDIIDTSEPPPMSVPVDLLPTLGQLNIGASIDIINVTQMPAGGTLLPVALVDFKQNPQPFVFPSNSPSSQSSSQTSSASNEDQGDDSGDDQGKGKGKGHQKDHGTGHGKGHQEDDNGDH